jgi:hypothetical protein
MCARSGSALLLALLLFAPSAHARKWTFETGGPFGLGLSMGAAQSPDTDLVEPPRSTSMSFSHFFGFSPFVDFGAVGFGLSGQLHSYPVVSGTGTDVQGTFSETSDVSSFLYGAHLRLSPFLSEDKRKRVYIKISLAKAIAQGENVRTYASGTAFSEKFKGDTRELLAAAGFEFFFVQNYSMAVELGFRQLEFPELKHEKGTALDGSPRSQGAVLANDSGTNRKLNQTGPFISLGLNLNF